MKCKTPLLTILLMILLIGIGVPQEQERSKFHWHYLAEVYLMFPNINGNIAIANLPSAEVEAGPGDIFGHIKMGAMFYFEATNDNWAISSDILYMKLGQDLEQGPIITGGDIVMKQAAWELAGLKHIVPWLEIGLAGRIIYLYSGLNLTTIGDPREGSASKTWFDPAIIVRSQGILKEKWLLQFRGDIGGFGVGSDLAWQIQAYAGYRFSKLFQATIGYRYIAIDYDSGEDRERFIYDINTYGLVIRFGFNF